MNDVVSSIKAACPADAHDLSTAEGRADWDRKLRAEIQKIKDEGVRTHAGQMIRDWRWVTYKRMEEKP